MTPCHLPLPGLSGDEPCGKCGQSARLHRNHKEFVDMTIDTDTGRIYPCAKCGTMRTKAEGGTTFTVCDDCWDASAAKSGTSKLMVDPRDARIRDLEEANAAIFFAWLQSADVPSEAPRVGPSITREQARAALDWHKRIGGEGFGIAPEWEPVYAMLRACADSEPAPTVQVGPAISRSDVREYLDGFGPGRGAVKSRVDKALRAYADGAGEELTDRWDEAIEAADVAVIAAPSALKTSTVDGPVSYYIERGVAQAAIRALKGRGR